GAGVQKKKPPRAATVCPPRFGRGHPPLRAGVAWVVESVVHHLTTGLPVRSRGMGGIRSRREIFSYDLMRRTSSLVFHVVRDPAPHDGNGTHRPWKARDGIVGGVGVVGTFTMEIAAAPPSPRIPGPVRC